jgi:hypothetical protein
VKEIDQEQSAGRGSIETHIPTAGEIEAARTPAGGWTRATLASWGISWPPARGWRERLIAQNPTHNMHRLMVFNVPNNHFALMHRFHLRPTKKNPRHFWIGFSPGENAEPQRQLAQRIVAELKAARLRYSWDQVEHARFAAARRQETQFDEAVHVTKPATPIPEDDGTVPFDGPYA